MSMDISHLMAEASLRAPPAVTADGTPVPDSALSAEESSS